MKQRFLPNHRWHQARNKGGLGTQTTLRQANQPFLVQKKSGPFSHFGPKKRCPKPPLQGTCQDQHQLGGSVAGRQGRQHVAASRQQETNDQAPGGREVGRQHAGEDLGRWDMLGPWIQWIQWIHWKILSRPNPILKWGHFTGSAMFGGGGCKNAHCVSSSKGDKQHISHKYGDVLETHDD